MAAVDPDGLALAAGPFRLRPTTVEDRPGIIAAGQARTIGGRMPWFPSPFPDHYADDWIRRAQAEWRVGRHFVFSILDAESAYVGSVVLSRVAADTFELSYWVLPSREGEGAATAAARAIVAWARGALAPRRFLAKTRSGASASQRILVNLGFAATGTDEQPTFVLEAA